jgi:hypothetical protein
MIYYGAHLCLKQALVRDGFQCVVTKVYDTHAVVANEELQEIVKTKGALQGTLTVLIFFQSLLMRISHCLQIKFDPFPRSVIRCDKSDGKGQSRDEDKDYEENQEDALGRSASDGADDQDKSVGDVAAIDMGRQDGGSGSECEDQVLAKGDDYRFLFGSDESDYSEGGDEDKGEGGLGSDDSDYSDGGEEDKGGGDLKNSESLSGSVALDDCEGGDEDKSGGALKNGKSKSLFGLDDSDYSDSDDNYEDDTDEGLRKGKTKALPLPTENPINLKQVDVIRATIAAPLDVEDVQKDVRLFNIILAYMQYIKDELKHVDDLDIKRMLMQCPLP